MVRQINMHSVFRLLRDKRRLRVSDMSRLSGLSPATVTYVLDRLVDMKLVKSVGAGRSTGGRRPSIYALNLEDSVMCGVDVRFDQVSVAFLDLEATVLWRKNYSVEDAGRSDLARLIEEGVNEGIASLALAPSHLIGIGVCIPGFVDSTGKRIVLDVNLNLRDVDLGEVLQARLQRPVFVVEEANAWMLAELEYGGLNLGQSALFVLIGLGMGRGIGGSIMVDGRIVTGHQGFAGEIGHTTLDHNGPRCVCGRNGCWEVLGNLSTFVGNVQKAVPSLSGLDYQTALSRLVPLLGDRDPKIFALFRDYVEVHADALANFIHILNPATIIVGGEITILGDAFLLPLREAVADRLMGPFRGGYSIVTATQVGDNALRGAIVVLTGAGWRADRPGASSR